MAGLHFHVNGLGRPPGKLVNKPPAPWGRLCGVLTQPHSLGLSGLAVAMAPCMASWATANPFPGPFILAVPPPGWSLVTRGCPTRLVSLPGSEVPLSLDQEMLDGGEEKEKKKFTVSLLVPCIPVSFPGMHGTIHFSEPSDDCSMHFYLKFLITFGGKAGWRGLT